MAQPSFSRPLSVGDLTSHRRLDPARVTFRRAGVRVEGALRLHHHIEAPAEIDGQRVREAGADASREDETRAVVFADDERADAIADGSLRFVKARDDECPGPQAFDLAPAVVTAREVGQ